MSANEISDKITQRLIKDAIFWRSSFQCDLFDNHLSKPFRDQLSMDEDMLCELSFGEEEELEDYYDDGDEDDDIEEGEEEEEEDYDDDEEDLDGTDYMGHEDLSSDEGNLPLFFVPNVRNNTCYCYSTFRASHKLIVHSDDRQQRRRSTLRGVRRRSSVFERDQ